MSEVYQLQNPKSKSSLYNDIKYEINYKKMLSLNDILTTTKLKEIHFLKIDTEGSKKKF